ncbi:PH domain-containing protein [Paenalkalicoccus suaedae]|uniref:PH domain-containing protein n=2 Tax=Paenalkalicoccus suaedae TaxID=2592382 RepID=A0A859FKB0_9BACI|nr:PH domain-containing protein [Paenalkalicoccus suaedae]
MQEPEVWNEDTIRAIPDQPLAEKTLTVWKIASALQVIYLAIIGGIYAILSIFFTIPLYILFSILGVLAVLMIINTFYIQPLKWRKWRYKVYDNELELMRGVFIVQRVIIPMIRVQHVDTKQGPLLRHYKLATVTVSTAATVHEIPGLDVVDADSLRDQIAKLAREADPDDE